MHFIIRDALCPLSGESYHKWVLQMRTDLMTERGKERMDLTEKDYIYTIMVNLGDTGKRPDNTRAQPGTL